MPNAEQPVPSSASRPATINRPRGQLAPPLPKDAPVWRRVVRAANRLVRGLVLHDGLIAAPAMAFHFFLSLLPLLVFGGYVVGLFARRRGVEAVLSPILDNLPSATDSIVRREVERLAGASGLVIGPVAALTFLWIASGGAHNLMNAIENVVGAPKRPWWKKRAIAIASVVTLLVTLSVSAFAIVRWDAWLHPRDAHVTASVAGLHLEPASSSRPPPPPPGESAPRRRARVIHSTGEQVLALTLSVLFGTLALAAFYRISHSHSKRVVRRVLPGAAVAVVLWLVVSWAFGVYVSSLANYAAFYGSLAAVAVLLVWLWLTSFAILIGAELNSQLEGLRD